MIIFTNMDDKALDRLIDEAYAEKQRRFETAFDASWYPEPVITGDKIADIKEYRYTHKVGLWLAYQIMKEYYK